MKIRCSHWFPLLAALCVGQAQARLDETFAQCEARYGKAITRIPGRAQDPAQMTYLFQSELTDKNNAKIPVRIRIEFNKEGRAWYIRYTGGYPSDATQTFLEFNSGDAQWGASESYNERTFYRTEAATPYQATQSILGPKRVLEIYSYECVQDQKALRIAQTKAIQADPNWEPLATPAGTAAAPTVPTTSGGNAPALKFNGF
jgi:hypothetical protein